jgi:hypothetical protein
LLLCDKNTQNIESNTSHAIFAFDQQQWIQMFLAKMYVTQYGISASIAEDSPLCSSR